MSIQSIVKTALVSTAFVLVTIFLLNRFGPTSALVQLALRP